MKTYWIREVRYYKYAIFACITLILCGIVILNEYFKDNNNNGIILTTELLHNITYSIPIYRVLKEGNIYIMYDKCVIIYITECKQSYFTKNMVVYYKKINGFYIIFNREYFMLYFAIFIFAFSILMLTFILYAYYDFYKLRQIEFKTWSKQKKCDIDMCIENDPSSFLFY